MKIESSQQVWTGQTNKHCDSSSSRVFLMWILSMFSDLIQLRIQSLFIFYTRDGIHNFSWKWTVFFQLFHFTQQNIGYYQIKKIIPLWILSFHYCCKSVEHTLLYFFSNHGWYPLIEWEKAFFFHWFFNCFSLPSAPL